MSESYSIEKKWVKNFTFAYGQGKWENFDLFFPLNFDSVIPKTHVISSWGGWVGRWVGGVNACSQPDRKIFVWFYAFPNISYKISFGLFSSAFKSLFHLNMIQMTLKIFKQNEFEWKCFPDAGTYICTANNDVGPPVTAVITCHVICEWHPTSFSTIVSFHISIIKKINKEI